MWKLDVLKVMRHVASDGSEFSAFAQRFLAEALPENLDWTDATTSGREIVRRRMRARTPFLEYVTVYEGDGDHILRGDTIDGEHYVHSIDHGVDAANQHYKSMRDELLGGDARH